MPSGHSKYPYICCEIWTICCKNVPREVLTHRADHAGTMLLHPVTCICNSVCGALDHQLRTTLRPAENVEKPMGKQTILSGAYPRRATTTCGTGQQLWRRARCGGKRTSGPNGRTAGSMGSMQINTRINMRKYLKSLDMGVQPATTVPPLGAICPLAAVWRRPLQSLTPP